MTLPIQATDDLGLPSTARLVSKLVLFLTFLLALVVVPAVVLVSMTT